VLPVDAQELLEQVRAAARLDGGAVEQRGRDLVGAQRRPDERVERPARQRPEVEADRAAVGAAPAGAPHEQIGARRHDEEHGRLAELARERGQQVERLLVGGLQVLGDDDERAREGILLEEPAQHGPRELGPLLRLGGERLGERALGHLEPEEAAQQRGHLGDAPVAEDPLELAAEQGEGLRAVRRPVELEPIAQQRRDERARRRRGRVLLAP
jgi:hypothetical protein